METSPERTARRRRRMATTLVLALVLAGAVVVVDRTGLTSPQGPRHTPADGAATSTAVVIRRSLSETMSVPGTLGYAGAYTVLGQDHGTVTALPAVGRVIRQGQVLYRVDGEPVVLLYGATPAFRTLSAAVTGPDVRQLNHALVALGYAEGREPISDAFTRATKAGVRRLQRHLGVPQTGELAWGRVVFEPTALRVATAPAALGGPADGPILTATSTTRQVTVALDAAQQSLVEAGDEAAIALPDHKTTRGRVTAIGQVATVPAGSRAEASSAPTVTVHVMLTDASATGTLDQAPVQVAITTDTVRNALVVPVNTLLALAGGGYALEVVDADGTRHLAPVTLGLFDDSAGLVQVTGAGVRPGQRVVVPTS